WLPPRARPRPFEQSNRVRVQFWTICLSPVVIQINCENCPNFSVWRVSRRRVVECSCSQRAGRIVSKEYRCRDENGRWKSGRPQLLGLSDPSEFADQNLSAS